MSSTIADAYVAFGHRLLRGGGLAPRQLPALHRFRAEILPRFDTFLRERRASMVDRMSRLSPEARAALSVLEGTPDLLGPLDQIRQETLHTRALAWALSPRRLQGTLGAEPLRRFLTLLARKAPEGTPTPGPELAVADPQLRAEPERVVPGRGRVDVWLNLPGHVVAVEAKVDHVLRWRQLEDYRAAVDAECAHTPNRRGLVVFLALEGTERPPDRRVVCLSWLDILEALLPVAASGSTGDYHYLGLWLRSVARSLATLGGEGPFLGWPPARQGHTLTFLERWSA